MTMAKLIIPGNQVLRGNIKVSGSKNAAVAVLAGAVISGTRVRLENLVLENVAKEPEIIDLSNFLNAMGACIRGAGTDIIRIKGVREFKEAVHRIIPDRIEAGTFLMDAAVTGGEVCVRGVIPKHLNAVIAKLIEAGIDVQTSEDAIRVKGTSRISPVKIRTFPYQGFPTDLQPLAMVLFTKAQGSSVINENVFGGRFKLVNELKRMGARIKVEGRTYRHSGHGSP